MNHTWSYKRYQYHFDEHSPQKFYQNRFPTNEYSVSCIHGNKCRNCCAFRNWNALKMSSSWERRTTLLLHGAEQSLHNGQQLLSVGNSALDHMIGTISFDQRLTLGFQVVPFCWLKRIKWYGSRSAQPNFVREHHNNELFLAYLWRGNGMMWKFGSSMLKVLV